MEEIGRGGMGIVYKGVHLSLGNRLAAIKTLPAQLAGDDIFLKKFMYEADILAKLHHQNIVNIYDIEAQEDAYYLIMEYVKGKTLAELIKSRGMFPPDQAAGIIRDVALALSHSHAKGIIHRDIKPANIMIDENGVVKVTDFGIARATEGAAVTHSVIIGTPKYMPPERIRDEKDLDGRSDIYSLGIVFYEMVTGRVPFHDDSDFSILEKQVKEPPPPPSEFIYDFPEAYEKIILECLEKNKEDRYPDCSALAAALQSAIARREGGNGKTDAEDIKSGGKIRTSVWKRFLIYGGILALLVIILGYMISRPPRPLPVDGASERQPLAGHSETGAGKDVGDLPVVSLRSFKLRSEALTEFLEKKSGDVAQGDLRRELALKIGVKNAVGENKKAMEIFSLLGAYLGKVALAIQVEKGYCDVILTLTEAPSGFHVILKSNVYGDAMMDSYEEKLAVANMEDLFSELDAIFRRNYCFNALRVLSALNPVNEGIGIEVETSGKTDRVFKIGDTINICMTPEQQRYCMLCDVNLDGIYLLFPQTSMRENLLAAGQTKCSGTIEVSPPTGNEMVFAMMVSEKYLLLLEPDYFRQAKAYHRWSYDLADAENAMWLCETLLMNLIKEPFDRWCTKSIFIKTHE